MKKPPATSKKSTRDATHTSEQIALRAEILWKTRGCPQGSDEEIWLEAERQLSEESRGISTGVSR